MRDVTPTKISAAWINGAQSDLRATIINAAVSEPRLRRRMWFHFAQFLKKCFFRTSACR